MRAIDTVRDLNNRWYETMTMAGVTLELSETGMIVIKSETGNEGLFMSDAPYSEIVRALVEILRLQKEEYRGYIISPKLDFGNEAFLINGVPYKHGWVVVKNHCNAMPGATWFTLRKRARLAIDILIEADGDADKFWKLMRARQ